MSSTITLRRAAKIRNRLTQHLAELRTKLRREMSVTVNVYDAPSDVIKQISNAENEFSGAVTRFMAVSQVLYGLRSRIDVVNAESGINKLLAEQAQLKGQLSMESSIEQHAEVVPSRDTIISRLSGAKERNAVSSYGNEVISISCVSPDVVKLVQTSIQQHQSRLDVIQDQLESLNSSHFVELTSSDLALLQSERLV